MTSQDWDCEAYGPELPKELATCFFQEVRHCTSLAECSARMEGERQRVFRRISELAAAGNETGVFLEGEFTNPDQLLNATDEEPEQ
jgi:hypothetical protein